jgi:hypothetical protein
MNGRHVTELASIEVESGVAENPDGTHRPFVTVRAVHDGGAAIGQLDVDTARDQALIFLAGAEAARHDAILVDLLTELELPAVAIGGLVTDLRARLAESDPLDREDPT